MFADKGFERLDKGDDHNCNEFNESVIKYAKSIGVKKLILVGRFQLLNESRYDNGEGGKEFGSKPRFELVNFDKYFTAKENQPKERRDILVSYIQKEFINLTKEFDSVVLVYPVPEVGWYVPSTYLKKQIRNSESSFTHDYNGYLQRIEVLDKIVSGVKNKSFQVLQLGDKLCDSKTKRCKVLDDNGLLYMDDDHLSEYGAKFMTVDFIEKLSLLGFLKN